MPRDARKVWVYLLGKSNWKLKKAEIAHDVEISAEKVKSALTCLRKMGFARVDRCPYTGRVTWFLYDDPRLNHYHDY